MECEATAAEFGKVGFRLRKHYSEFSKNRLHDIKGVGCTLTTKFVSDSGDGVLDFGSLLGYIETADRFGFCGVDVKNREQSRHLQYLMELVPQI